MIGTSLGSALLGAACVVLCAGVASAREQVTVKTSYYTVSGATGVQIYRNMQSRAPRPGFQARAMANTNFSVDWTQGRLAEANGGCRVVAATPTLSINYLYPKLAGKTPIATQQRWNRFVSVLRDHEQVHGQLAKEMVRKGAREMQGVAVANDRGCAKTRRKMVEVGSRIYKAYEAKQIAFDAAEHRSGGRIDVLIKALIAAK